MLIADCLLKFVGRMADMYLLLEIDGAETEEAQRTTSMVNTIRVKLLVIICMQLLACMKRFVFSEVL